KNLAVLAQHQIPFAITSDLLQDKKQFLQHVRKAIAYGLDSREALRALTTRPAEWIGEADQLGQLKPGYLANFLITDKPVFEQNAVVLENWVQGVPNVIQKAPSELAHSQFDMELNGKSYQLTIDGKGQKLTLKTDEESNLQGTVAEELDRINLIFRGNDGFYYQLNGKRQDNGDITG